MDESTINRRTLSAATTTTTSPTSSCVSSELNYSVVDKSNNKEEEELTSLTNMVLVGCPSCLMYVMLSEKDPKCPKCKSSVLLDFLHVINNNKLRNN